MGHRWEAEIPAVGRHIALNAAAAIATAFALGIDPGLAAKELVHTQLPPMRMEIVEFQGGHVLLDTYNASPPSMIAAIETLSELPVQGHRLAVIGEMKELGDFTDDAHDSVEGFVSLPTCGMRSHLRRFCWRFWERSCRFCT